eukprot:Unigene8732_Nuclearia_a/m.26721 Unigene8732_Nuclearia_a/g.26721  ORF Unigene8732_Nuclearia_a/g.26721 Unigene8732_Nuclearia_a/m.26721 type:complete len:448 (+) Unigene8732_Nuclearia_a:817-2160(+)
MVVLDHAQQPVAHVDHAHAHAAVPVVPSDALVDVCAQRQPVGARHERRLRLVHKLDPVHGGLHQHPARAHERRARVGHDRAHRRRLGRAPLPVRLLKLARRRLAIAADLRDRGRLLHLVLDLVHVDRALVRQRVEQVERLGRLLARLLVAKDEIDPVVKVLRHEGRLERLQVLAHKQTRITLGPRRQDHVVHALAVLLHAEVVHVEVAQELGEVEKLGDELLHVRGRVRRRQRPRLLDRVERAVGDVEAAALKLEERLRERLDTHEKVQHDAQVRVVRAVVVRLLALHLLQVLKLLEELLQPLGALRAHRLGQVAERRRVGQIKLGRAVVGQHKREDRVLRQVIERAAGDLVQVHQVLKVGYLPAEPSLLHQPRLLALVLLVLDAVRQVHRHQLVVHVVARRYRRKGEQVRLAVREEDLERIVLEQVAALVHLANRVQRDLDRADVA